jgi:hypothetical protein
VTVEYGASRGHARDVTAELVQRGVNLIIAASLNGAIEAKSVIKNIPHRLRCRRRSSRNRFGRKSQSAGRQCDWI